MIKWMTFIILGTLLSCSGYRIPNRTNPLDVYGITTIAVPMFVNQSSLPNVAGPMTKEVKSLLMGFVDLKVRSQFYSVADAVLVGIVSTPKHHRDASKTTNTKFTSGTLKQSIGSRNEFFIPSQTQLDLKLRLILIRRPSHAELELLKQPIGRHLKPNLGNKIIFNEELNLTGTYSRIIDDNLSVDKGGVVNFTKNKKAEENTIKEMASNAARDFKEVILNAF